MGASKGFAAPLMFALGRWRQVYRWRKWKMPLVSLVGVKGYQTSDLKLG